MIPAVVMCVDGSGNQNVRAADLKRPIYRVDFRHPTISRIKLGEKTALEYFKEECKRASRERLLVIAADVVIGLPPDPSDVWSGIQRFPEWLNATRNRIGRQDWRIALIADNLDVRSPQKPFVKVKEGTKKDIASFRNCDKLSGGESIYCVDHSSKQVGRASLQFWFDVLLPLRDEFATELAIWPFETIENRSIVVAECYPVASTLR